MLRAACLLAALLPLALLNAAGPAPREKVLFDFESPDDLRNWSSLKLPATKDAEPAVTIESDKRHATSGRHSLKLTFAGGVWPTVTTALAPADWSAYPTLEADVTVSRECLVGFSVLQEKSIRGGDWEQVISRWTKTVFLKPGTNHVVASLRQPNDYSVHSRWGKVVRFEVFLYRPNKGESIWVDNVRLTATPIKPKAATRFTVASTDWEVEGQSSANAVIALGKKLKKDWRPAKARTVEEVEADMARRHAELKKKHPKAVLAVLRDGWQDAYFNSHGPDTAFAARAENRGGSATHEVFMRHRSPLMRVDLSSIPKGSNILAAELLIIRAVPKYIDDRDPERKPTMWVVEPCLRPWKEMEVNAFEYARGKFWKDVGGMHWGDDPDFGTTFLAYGPGQGKVNTWDFTEAVRYWTNGKHANHGFMLHGDSHDYMIAHTREAKNAKDRPAVLVIYEPE